MSPNGFSTTSLSMSADRLVANMVWSGVNFRCVSEALIDAFFETTNIECGNSHTKGGDSTIFSTWAVDDM